MVAAFVAAFAARGSAEPKPSAVDIKAYRDQLVVLQDAAGGTYVLKPATFDMPMFYGVKGAALYQQNVKGGFKNGDRWQIRMFAPRAKGAVGSILHLEDGTYVMSCNDDDSIGLSEITGDKAKQILTKSSFMTSNLIRVPHALARDDTGIYYYVDKISEDYGGNGFRFYVGKKGAVKQVSLTDVTSDSAGEVYSTKIGDLRVTRYPSEKRSAVWIRGEKRTELVFLDVGDNYRLIYGDLGIYGTTGTVCDNS
jgi:hypothetical protein